MNRQRGFTEKDCTLSAYVVLFEIRDILKFAVRRVKTALKDAEYVHALLHADCKLVLFAGPLEYDLLCKPTPSQ
jgi:hypothetical protein